MEKGETEIMVPMTNTLLIRGKMVDAPMMVELGGGILMEKNTEGWRTLDSNLIWFLSSPSSKFKTVFKILSNSWTDECKWSQHHWTSVAQKCNKKPWPVKPLKKKSPIKWKIWKSITKSINEFYLSFAFWDTHHYSYVITWFESRV